MSKLAILQIRRPEDKDDPICQKCAALNAKFGNTPDYISEEPITDFAQTRNQLQQDAIRHDGEIEWFLWIDSDEVFPYKITHRIIDDKHESIKIMSPIGDGYLGTLEHKKCGVFIQRYNLFGDESHYRIDSGCYPDLQMRLISSDIPWKNPIHEGAAIGMSIHWFRPISLFIYHYGWLRDKQWQEQKHARFHTLAGKPATWQFPLPSEVTLKLLPREKVLSLG